MSLQPDPGNEPRPTGLVIFDRDGVINEVFFDGTQVRGPWALSELALLPGVERAVAAVTDAASQLLWRPTSLTLRVCTSLMKPSASSISESTNESRESPGSMFVAMTTAMGVDAGSQVQGCLWTRWLNLELTQPDMDGWGSMDGYRGRASSRCAHGMIEDEFSWRPTSQGPPPAGLRPDAVVASTGQAVEVILRAQDNR